MLKTDCGLQFLCILTNLKELCRRLGEVSCRAERRDQNMRILAD